VSVSSLSAAVCRRTQRRPAVPLLQLPSGGAVRPGFKGRLFGIVARVLYLCSHIVAMIGSAGWGLDQRARSARLGTPAAAPVCRAAHYVFRARILLTLSRHMLRLCRLYRCDGRRGLLKTSGSLLQGFNFLRKQVDLFRQLLRFRLTGRDLQLEPLQSINGLLHRRLQVANCLRSRIWRGSVALLRGNSFVDAQNHQDNQR
jgi:hypothetical protein